MQVVDNFVVSIQILNSVCPCFRKGMMILRQMKYRQAVKDWGEDVHHAHLHSTL